ncbi:MAG: sodium-dependent transporter [Sedimentisphaerales bacterium]|nr:sodium-dependent transporter [Sedimentisphaerales bacterium]
MSELLQEQRENWGSRGGFVLAAIGSAVGLGNVWRFPYTAYTNGGGAFLIPYIIGMFVVGVPLLIMELSLGHFTQLAAPGAFHKISRKFEFVGWWPVVLGFIIVCYYSVVLAWCVNYLIFSFKTVIPWASDAKSFFFSEYLGVNETHKLGSFRLPIVLALLAVWLGMYLCIFKGVKWVGKIVLWTVPLPWLMLLILTVRGLTLEGAIKGLEYYLEPDWSMLTNVVVWRHAFGQVFFSMSLAFGVMVAYASFLHRKSDINNNALIISIADLATSFIAGIVVFTTMGALAARENIAVQEVLSQSQGIGLAFVAFPTALSHLPATMFFSVVFFAALILLGIDSAFSITESVLASVCDKSQWPRRIVLPAMSVLGLGCGLVFTTEGGLSWLGTVDSFVNGTWGILLVGLVECLVVGWLYDVRILRRHANARSDWRAGKWWEILIKFIIPIILGTLFVWSLYDDVTSSKGFLIDNEGQLIWPNIIGLGLMMAALAVSLVLGRIGRKNHPVST